MKKKYMFFDIDGTLTNDNPGGVILPSTRRALKKLQENGHFVAIATGRAHWMAMDAATETGILNLVHDGGNGITIDGKVQWIHPLDRQKALLIIDEALAGGFHVEVVIDDTPAHYTKTAPKEDSGWCEIIVDPNMDFHQLKEIYKVYITMTQEEESQLKHLKTLGYMRYRPDGIIVEPDDKYHGIVDLVKLVGGNEEDIVVFGDGHNDYTMFKQAPMSIAMGNAIDELKEIATYITKSNKENGIEHACQHFGWID